MDEAVDIIHRKLTEEEEENLVERTPLPAERIAELLKEFCDPFQEYHSTEGGPAEGRGAPHHYFQAERLSLTFYSCRILLHIGTISTTRGGAQ